MDADSFVEMLKRVQPTVENLIARDYPRELAERIRASHECSVRASRLGLPTDDPLLDLVDRYDVAQIAIGCIEFRNEPVRIATDQYGQCLIVADADADYIASSLESGDVLFLDGNTPAFVMLKVARDGGAFLDALIELRTGLNRQEDDKSVARRCADRVGLEGSVGFFESIY